MYVYGVRSLEDMSLEASFKDILDTLIQCYTQHPEARHISFIASCEAIIPTHFLTHEKLCTYVRSRLDHHLVGLMSPKVREKYVKLFYYGIANNQGGIPIDLSLFLDAVLDDSFKLLETHIIVSTSNPVPCSKLITTIAKWSPILEKLTINFSSIKKEYHLGEMKELKPSFMPLASLQHLTHLSLLEISGKTRFTVLTLIGKACPSLTYLSVAGSLMDKSDILALILGDYAYNLLNAADLGPIKFPLWCEDKVLEHLVIPTQFLSPVCSTLRELRLSTELVEEEHPNKIRHPEFSFALRHLPLLQVVDKRCPTSLAVTSLHKNANDPNKERKSLAQFLYACNKAFGTAHSTLDYFTAPFSGKLLLTKLDFVNVQHKRMLRAVGSTCPLLKEVVFCDRSFASNADVSAAGVSPMELESVVHPEDLRSIFNGWPKLTTLGFVYVSPKYVKAILEAFGPELQELELKHCHRIMLTDLAPCRQLKSLRIMTRCSSLDAEQNTSTLDAATFLPQLKSFHSSICLGAHSRLFEEKPTLVRLFLHCSHIKTEGEPLRKRFKHSDQTSDLGLDRIRQLWSQLEVLAIWQFAQLSLPVMAYLIPHLHNLKLVTLPERITLNDPALVHTMNNDLLSRNPPAKINLGILHNDARCKMVEHL